LNQRLPHTITPRAQWIVVAQLSNTRLQDVTEVFGLRIRAEISSQTSRNILADAKLL